MFNILSVLIFLPLELATSYLETVTALIVGATNQNATISAPNFLHEMTAPLIHLIVELDLDVLEHLGIDDAYENKTILKHFCPDKPDDICKRFINFF